MWPGGPGTRLWERLDAIIMSAWPPLGHCHMADTSDAVKPFIGKKFNYHALTSDEQGDSKDGSDVISLMTA